MNSVYLKLEELEKPILRGDRRYQHITKILKKRAGDWVAACCSDGSTGLANIEEMTEAGLSLSYVPQTWAPELRPIRLLLGFPRPIQAGRILKDLTTLGVEEIWFILTDTSEKSYAQSDFFRNKDFESHLIEGAEQAGNPRLPSIRTFWSLDRALEDLGQTAHGAVPVSAPGPHTDPPGENGVTKIVLHVGTGLPTLMEPNLGSFVNLAIGSERGWTDREIGLFRKNGFSCCSMGDRILKTETATVAAVSIVLARLGFM
jgi:RsmE family RNA methyltransferase